MKIKSITPVGNRLVYDLSIASDDYDMQQYAFENGVISHNTGAYYSADTIWILGRQQDKDGSDIKGYHFVINVEKSRYVKEKSKVPISISWEGGINRWSGLLELALEHGSVIKPKQGWYSKPGEEKSYREKQIINHKEFWIDIFKNTDFSDFIQKKYQIGSTSSMMDYDEVE